MADELEIEVDDNGVVMAHPNHQPPRCGDCGLVLVAMRGARDKFLFWKCPVHGRVG